MKIKQVYISDENFEKLRDCNASALVNELITNHFKETKSKEMTLDEVNLEIRKIELEEEYQEKKEELQHAN